MTEELEPLFGPLPTRAFKTIGEGLAEADRRFSALVDLLEERTGFLFSRTASPLVVLGPNRARRNRYATASDDLVSVDLDVAGASDNAWPPWHIEVSVQVKCDAQPPRHHNCLHDIAQEDRHAETPQAVVDELLAALDRVRGAVAVCSRSELVDFRHKGEPMS